MAGLQVFPGVIDNDYTGEIKIMASSPKVISTVQRATYCSVIIAASAYNQSQGQKG